MGNETKMKLHFLDIVEKDRLKTTTSLGQEIFQKAKSSLAVMRGRLLNLATDLESYQKENVEEVLEQIDQLETLLQSATDFVSPEANLKSDRVSPFQIVTEIETFFQFRLSRQNIQVLNLVPKDLLLRASQADLHQIFNCLFDNAIEALEESQKQIKCIFVQYQKTEKFHILSIEDNGPGVSASTLPLLFTPFITTKKDHTGTSLAICQKVAEKAGWSLKVASREKFGARFEVLIPI